MNYLSQLATFLFLYTLSNSDYQKSLLFSIIIDLCSPNYQQYNNNNNNLFLTKPTLKYDSRLKPKHINCYNCNNNLSRYIKNINTSLDSNTDLTKIPTTFCNVPTTFSNYKNNYTNAHVNNQSYLYNSNATSTNSKKIFDKHATTPTNTQSDFDKHATTPTNTQSDFDKHTTTSTNTHSNFDKHATTSTNTHSNFYKHPTASTNSQSDLYKHPTTLTNIHGNLDNSIDTHNHKKKKEITSSIQQLKKADILKVSKFKNISCKNDLPIHLPKFPLNLGRVPFLIGSCHIIDIFMGSLKFSYPINNVIITSNKIVITNNYLLADNFMGASSALFYFEGYLKTTFYTLEPNPSSKCMINSSYKDNIIYTPFTISKYLNIGYLLENECYLLENPELNITNFTYETSKELMKVNDFDKHSTSYNNCNLVITLDYSINIYSK